LKAAASSDTVPDMAPHARPRTIRADRRRRARSARRARRLLGGLVLGVILLVTLLLTAFGSGSTGAIRSTRAPNLRLLPAGPPQNRLIATYGDNLNLALPISGARVTAIGYHASGDGALALSPLGRQANQGLFRRAAHTLFGDGGSGLRYYELGGDDGPGTSALDVGAPPATDVYSPVAGTVVGISPFVRNGIQFGARIQIQPKDALSLVVVLTQLRPDPALTVGSTLTASTSKVGKVVDLSGVEKQALSRYTQDAGNHVTIQVFPAAPPTLR
jgi:hypothetical protein